MAKIVFCQKVVYAYFGTMIISSFLKQHGHKVELVMDTDVDRVVKETLELIPDVVAFSTLTATGEFEWALEVAEKLKQANQKILTVFGGVHPTLFPEEAIKSKAVDVVCRGEGEHAMLELCSRLGKKQPAGAEKIARTQPLAGIQNLWVRTPKGISKGALGKLVEDLDEFPFPDRQLYQKYGYFNNPDSVDVLAGRGCPFNCSFCYNPVFMAQARGKGKFVRKRSVENLVAELEEIKRKYKPKFITFVDELFTLDKHWLREFLQKYRERIALPFICSVRADVMDDETAAMLAAGGASRVCLGLETGIEVLRNTLLKKRVTNEQLVRTAEVLHRHGIKFLTTNMLGLPGETVENAFETIELNRRIKADYVWYSVFQPYPELEITKQMISSGIISPNLSPAEFDTTYFKGSLLKQKNIKQLVNLHKLFYPAFKLRWLKPLFRQLIRLPPNPLFELVFILSFGWFQVSYYHRNPLQVLAMGISNLKVFYEKPKKREK